MYTRSRDKETGTFSYKVWDWNGDLYAEEGDFVDHQECDKQAELAERRMTLEMQSGEKPMTIDDVIQDMSDDELLAELFEGA